MDGIRSFLKKIPKTEMHLHLEGALPYDMLRGLDSGRYAQYPDSWRDGYKFESFGHFDSALLGMAMPWFNSPERYGEAASAIFERMEADGVRYAEVSFASGILQFLGVDGAAVAEAVAKAAPNGMRVKIFMGIHHDGRPKHMEKVFEDALAWKYLDGVDLHGDETVALESWTREYWHEARKKGLHTKAHAGEFCGADFIEKIIDELGVKQIEHGVRAVENPKLVERLAREKISLDVCPTSNVKLGVAESHATHGLRALRDNGVLCTLNSDDPLIFGCGILDEYENCVSRMGMTLCDCLEIAADGWRAAKVSAGVRADMLAEIEKLKSGRPNP